MASERFKGFTIEPMGADHLVRESVTHEEEILTRRGMARVEEVLLSGEYDMVILDEINNSMKFGLVTP